MRGPTRALQGVALDRFAVAARSNDLTFVRDVTGRLEAAGIAAWAFGGWAEEPGETPHQWPPNVISTTASGLRLASAASLRSYGPVTISCAGPPPGTQGTAKAT
jgi:hypothetical protein